MNLDANASLRASVRRLIAAAEQDGQIEVTVRRVDLALLLACFHRRFYGPVAVPVLHPDQQ